MKPFSCASAACGLVPIVWCDYLILACLVFDRGLDKCPAEKKTASPPLSDRYNTATSCCFKCEAILYYLVFSYSSRVAENPLTPLQSPCEEEKTPHMAPPPPFFFSYYSVSSQGQRFLLPCSLRVMKQKHWY